jgi:hypothetical protein
VGGGLAGPPGGVVLVWPGAQPPPRTEVNGRPAAWDGRELRIRDLPAEVVTQGTP